MTTIDLKTERTNAGLSRQELASLAGVTYSSIATMERGGLPRGGEEEAEKIWTALGQKPTPLGEVAINEGDVVAAKVGTHDVMLLVKTSDDKSVTGTEMLTCTANKLEKSLAVGARTFAHKGRTYLLRHTRTIARTAITRHWVTL
jgi:DNA-binding XRE family transcriptional regulator